MLTFNTDGMVAQRFPFPAPIMDYILKNLKPQHLIKLYQCCKFFYAKYRQNIIRNLEVVDDGEEEMFHPNKTTICTSNPALKKLIDFWFSDSFIYNAPSNVELMPSFSHCTIKKLEACDYLTWDEFKALTKAGTVEELKIGEVHHNGESVPIEDIIAAVPNGTSFHFTSCEFSQKSFESMVSLDHKAKISNFILENLGPLPQNTFSLLFEFFFKNAISDCNIRFDFQMFDGDSDEIQQINSLSAMMGNFMRGYILTALETKKNFDLEESASALMP